MKLRRLKEKDADKMLEWMHSKETKEIFAKDFNKYTKENVLNFIKNSYDEENINYACVDDDDNYLGTVSLKNIDKENKHAEYAISFCKEAQGTGAASFATKEILRIAFKELNLNKVYLDVLETNKRAINFYNKFGFIKTGESREHIIKNNKYINLYWYEILSKEYL